MCLNIKLYDSTSHCEKTEINRGVLNTPALTGTNCMIEQPNLAMKLDICSLQTTTYHAKQGI